MAAPPGAADRSSSRDAVDIATSGQELAGIGCHSNALFSQPGYTVHLFTHLGATLLVFGIDPGSTATGFSAVYREASRFVLVEAGVIRTRVKDPIPVRLRTIHEGLTAALDRIKPECVSIEAIFRHRSSESALRLGQARGVALLAAAQHDLEVTAYNPMTVKKCVGGTGRAGKAEMVRLVARLVGEKLATDAADATAIAITHIINSAFASRVSSAHTTRSTR